MKYLGLKAGLVLAGSVAASLLLLGGAQADVNVNIYATHTTDSGGGAPYLDSVGSFISPNVQFGTDTGFNWHPLGLGSFGADITGCYIAPTTGTYTFGTYSDDGSQLFLNSTLNVDNGGPTAPRFIAGTPITLTADQMVPLEIQYYEDFGGPAGLDLLVERPGETEFSLVTQGELSTTWVPDPAPEPGSLALLATGGLPLLGFLRRRRLAA